MGSSQSTQRPSLLNLFVGLYVATVMVASWASSAEESLEHEPGTGINYLVGNHICPVMGNPVNPVHYVVYKNEEDNVFGRIYICCPGCDKKIERHLDKVYANLYRTDKKTGEKIGPIDLNNDTCPVSGQPVSEEAFLEYNGFIVHLCSAECSQKFLESPDPVLLKLIPNPDEFRYDPPARPAGHQ